MGHLHFENWGPSVNETMHETFVGTSQWPISAGALAVLVDLGMSDGDVAEYFDVDRADVVKLRADYGL